MSHAVVREVPYREDSAVVFADLADRPWAVFLDSGRPYCEQGRYDILSSDPVTLVITKGAVTEVHTGGDVRVSTEDPFRVLGEALGPLRKGAAGLPFGGGAIGYFGYDLARRLERLPTLAKMQEQLPEMALGIYHWGLVVDHQARRSWLVGEPPRGVGLRDGVFHRTVRTPRNLALRPRQPFRITGAVQCSLDYEGYRAAFGRIQRYIREGDCYQVNFARRFDVGAQGDPWLAYGHLRRLNPAPFGAYLSTPFGQVLSSSPERFLAVRDGEVETRPIKGTRPRSPDPEVDRALADALSRSPKDRAENVMIVDLLRNDLGKTCVVGSIRVPELCKLEHYARVHHLVSTVRGRLAPGRTALDLLRGCFPGGSITGAPKLRAMEIIEELEPLRRGVYCGAIGYVGFDGAMDSNIAIRTPVFSDGRLHFWAGGGIVADSEVLAEYRETVDKAAPLLDLMRHLGATEGDFSTPKNILYNQ